MLPVFKTAAKALLVHLGEEGLLRGATPCRIQLQHDVELSGLDNEFETAANARILTSLQSVASIESIYDPKVRDTITVTDASTGDVATYRLDVQLRNNGAMRKFIVLKLP